LSTIVYYAYPFSPNRAFRRQLKIFEDAGYNADPRELIHFTAYTTFARELELKKKALAENDGDVFGVSSLCVIFVIFQPISVRVMDGWKARSEANFNGMHMKRGNSHGSPNKQPEGEMGSEEHKR